MSDTIIDARKPTFVFLDLNSEPWLVHNGWLHYWHQASKAWVTARELRNFELGAMEARKLNPEQAALYAPPFPNEPEILAKASAAADNILKNGQPCPADTDGDGDCGRPACPVCSIPAAEATPLSIKDRHPERPAWKKPKHQADKERWESFKQTPVGEALPRCAHRLSFLQDRDMQLLRLLDHLQSMGIPMGGESWADRAVNRICHLEDAYKAVSGFLRGPKGAADIEELGFAMDHARKMFAKHSPPSQTTCDWCGWPGARGLGDGTAACYDCLPDPAAEDPYQSEDYQRYLAKAAEGCAADDSPCDACLAGGVCDGPSQEGGGA